MSEYVRRRCRFFDEPRFVLFELLDVVDSLRDAVCAERCARDEFCVWRQETSSTHSHTWLASIIKTDPVGPAFFPTKLSAAG